MIHEICFSFELKIINGSLQVILGWYNSLEEQLITPKCALSSSSAAIKVQTSQTVQGKPVKRFGNNSDTTMVQCRKSLFLELLSNSSNYGEKWRVCGLFNGSCYTNIILCSTLIKMFCSTISLHLLHPFCEKQCPEIWNMTTTTDETPGNLARIVYCTKL